MLKIKTSCIVTLLALVWSVGMVSGYLIGSGPTGSRQLEIAYQCENTIRKETFIGADILYDIETGYYLVIATDSTEQLIIPDDKAPTLYISIKGMEKGTWKLFR